MLRVSSSDHDSDLTFKDQWCEMLFIGFFQGRLWGVGIFYFRFRVEFCEVGIIHLWFRVEEFGGVGIFHFGIRVEEFCEIGIIHFRIRAD